MQTKCGQFWRIKCSQEMKINEMKIILMQLEHRLDLRYAVNVGMDQPIGNLEGEGWGTHRRGTR